MSQKKKPSNSKGITNKIFVGDGSLSFMWSAIEVNVGIICASIPMLKPLVILIIPGFLSLSGHGSRTRHESTHQAGQRDLNANTNSNTQSIQSTQSTQRDPSVNAYDQSQPTQPDLRVDTSDQSTIPCDGTPNIYTAQCAPKISPVGAPLRQVWKSLLLVTTLFFFWGFAYGLLGVLRSKSAALYNFTTSQSLGLQGAYFA